MQQRLMTKQCGRRLAVFAGRDLIQAGARVGQTTILFTYLHSRSSHFIHERPKRHPCRPAIAHLEGRCAEATMPTSPHQEATPLHPALLDAQAMVRVRRAGHPRPTWHTLVGLGCRCRPLSEGGGTIAGRCTPFSEESHKRRPREKGRANRPINHSTLLWDTQHGSMAAAPQVE